MDIIGMVILFFGFTYIAVFTVKGFIACRKMDMEKPEYMNLDSYNAHFGNHKET